MSRWIPLMLALSLVACDDDGNNHDPDTDAGAEDGSPSDGSPGDGAPGDGDGDGAPSDGGDGAAEDGADGGTDSEYAVELKVSPDVFCVGGSCATVWVGDTLPLVAVVTDADGNEVTKDVVFSSADESLATISAEGLVTGVGPGAVELRAEAEGAIGTLTVTVNPRAITRIEVDPTSVQFDELNETAVVTAVAYDDLDNVVPDAAFEYVAANPSVASVDGTGTITALSQGATMIWVVAGNAEGAVSVVVKDVLPATPGFALAEIASGINFGCGATAEGKAYCWGWNYWGQLGNGERGSELDAFPTPLPVHGDHVFHGLSGAESHGCALDENDAAWCWGANGSGQLGTADEEIGGITIPNPVDGELAFAQISAGYDHTCAVDTAGKAYCFGANFQGGLGVGDYDDRRVPTAVRTDLTFREVHAGLGTSCGLATTGAAYCWGQNDFGQVGSGVDDFNASFETPQAVLGGHSFIQLDMRSSSACGVTTDGAIYCWGRNETAQLGDGSTTTGKSTPVKVASDETFVEVAVGIWHVCGRTTAGDAWCWGLGHNGQLGHGSVDSSESPVKVIGGLSFTSLVGGGFQTCGITAEGEGYCWGENSDGRIGTGFAGPGSLSASPWPVAHPN